MIEITRKRSTVRPPNPDSVQDYSFDIRLPASGAIIEEIRLGFIPGSIDIDNTDGSVPIYGTWGGIRLGALTPDNRDFVVGPHQLRSLIWPRGLRDRRQFRYSIPNAASPASTEYVRIYISELRPDSISGTTV